MSNLLPDGDFELELWTVLGDYAEYTEVAPLTGLQAARLEFSGFVFGGAGAFWSPAFDVTADTPAVIQLWVRAANKVDTQALLRVTHYPNGIGGAAEQILEMRGTDFDAALEYQQVLLDVTPTTNQDKLVIFGYHQGGFGGNIFRIDNAKYLQGAELMAVKLAERGVGSVVSCLQTYLPTELTAIDTERADSITMAAPANVNYYNRPKSEITGATAHIEVFEGMFGFNNFFGDSGDSRAAYLLPVTVRLTYYNRSGGGRDEMVTRMRRYSAGVFNTISKHTDLSDSDAATNVTELTQVTPPWAEIDDSTPSVTKGRITLQLTVKCNEVQT